MDEYVKEYGVVTANQRTGKGAKLLSTSFVKAVSRAFMLAKAMERNADISKAKCELGKRLAYEVPYGKGMAAFLVHTHDGEVWEDHEHRFQFRVQEG